ncbi:MAG: fasciclin domain-containing protein [Gammaproteobacteria bacterium]
MIGKKLLSVALVGACLGVANVQAGDHGHQNSDADAHQHQATQDIVMIAAGNKDFEMLVAALTAAGLIDTLKGDGPFTVFAPTDEAFAALPEGTLESLLKPENKDRLISILTYHVVPGNVKAADVAQVTEAKTVQGDSVKVTVNDSGVMIDDAKVLATDIEASNGVIHVIDQVILPTS